MVPSQFEETLDKTLFSTPWQYALETSRGKATEVAKKLQVGPQMLALFISWYPWWGGIFSECCVPNVTCALPSMQDQSDWVVVVGADTIVVGGEHSFSCVFKGIRGNKNGK